MKMTRYSEPHILAFLRQTVLPVAEPCQEPGMHLSLFCSGQVIMLNDLASKGQGAFSSQC